MNELLADIKAKLQNGDYKNEEHIRLSLVARVLQKLGWDIWNPKEVNTEFIVVPNEDKTRVDVALFLRPFAPAVFIEIKDVGQIQGRLAHIERQLRDYNRNNTAMFTIITDGREWRFYFSQTGGEFSKKCFETFNFAEDNLNDIEESLATFLSKSEIENGNAKNKAENYLQKNQRQQTAEDCLPEARRKISEPPYPSLPVALVSLVCEKGFSITQDEAVRFIKEADERKPPAPIAYQTTRTPTPYSDDHPESEKKAASLAGGKLMGSAAFVRKMFGDGLSKTEAHKKLLATYPAFERDHAGWESRWNMAERLSEPGREKSYVSMAGRNAFIRKLRDESNDWSTAWEKILAKYPGSSIGRCKKVWEKKALTPKDDNAIDSNKSTGGKMAFVDALLMAKGGSRKTKTEIVELYLKEFPDVKEKTAKNTVSWAATTMKKCTGKESNHLPTVR